MTRTPNQEPSVIGWLKARRSLPAASLRWLYNWFTVERKASYGLAVMRMVSGALILGWLLVNIPVASKIWGPGSAYLEPYRSVLGYQWPLDILRDAGMGVFVVWYAVAAVLALAFMLGWKTRFVTPLLFIFYTAINAQNTPISDGGNYFIRIMLIYLIFADLSKRWSLDAWLRQRKEQKRREHEFATILHNVALCLVVAQLCIVYFEAGMYKIQGALWQEGTAMYYPISSEAYGIFPWLSSLITWNSWVVVLITYLTVIIQVAFPFMLFNKISRRIALVAVLGMHIGIAVVMGLPFFSGIMASADAVLVSSATWLAVYAWLSGCWRKVFGRRHQSQEPVHAEETDQDETESTKSPVSV